jgi:hypothetical protein
MTRRSRSQRELGDLQWKIQHTYHDSPLDPIGDKLLEILQGTVEATRAGTARPNQAVEVASYIRMRLDALPQSFGPRFLVDSTLIQAIAEEWSQGPVLLSSMIVPRYTKEWGHQLVDVASTSGQHHWVNIVRMLGEDDLRSIDLLDYPWLCHELGHNIHSRDGRFAQQFQGRLDECLKSLRTRAIADRGSARMRATTQIDRIEQVWKPTRDQENWPYEIAADLVALWTCGPAFLATFTHQLTELRPNPYLVTPEHPPYDVRVAALIDAGRRLGWDEQVGDVERIKRGWATSELAASRDNGYVALADQALITCAVTCGLDTCGALRLPRACPESMERLKGVVLSPTSCDFGGELLVAAWLAEAELSDEKFDEWHESVVEELARAVRSESR